MKKLLIILMTFLLFTGCSKQTYTEPVEINYSEFQTKIESKESFVLFIWQTGCSHCEMFKPKLNEVIKKYGLLVYSINLQETTEIEYSKIKNKTFVDGTPTMVYMKDGVVQQTKLIGNKSETEIVEFIKKYNIIK